MSIKAFNPIVSVVMPLYITEKSRLSNIKLGYKAIPSMESKGKASLPKKNKKRSLLNRLIIKIKR